MAFVQSQSVFQWPEWKAFAERLGISDEPYTTAITIRIAGDEVVEVTQTIVGDWSQACYRDMGAKQASEQDTPVVATEARKVGIIKGDLPSFTTDTAWANQLASEQDTPIVVSDDKREQTMNAAYSEYENTEPRQLGNLHQRMRYVMEVMRRIGHKRVGNELWQAVFDLQTEVMFHTPEKPPYGHRPSPHFGN